MFQTTMILDAKATLTLRDHFPSIHPLMFQRSIEHAKSAGELFDILSAIPSGRPVTWDAEVRRWVLSKDPTLADEFDFEGALQRFQEEANRLQGPPEGFEGM